MEDYKDDYQDDYSDLAPGFPKTHGAFKVLLWLMAASVVFNLLSPLFIQEQIAVVWSHSPLLVLLLLFFGIVVPTAIAVMAFHSLRYQRGDTPYLIQAYIVYMILGTIAIYQVDCLNWRMMARIAVWVPCFLYVKYSKQVKRLFPEKERHVSIRLVVTLMVLAVLFVVFTVQLKDTLPYNVFNDDTVLIDESTLKENEYSDGLIRITKPAGLECGTHYINGEEIITLFNDDCVYYLKSGLWEAEVATVNDSLLAALAGPDFTRATRELMSDSDFGLKGDPKIDAHRKCYIYYTKPYPTMVDIVILRDWRTAKYCLVYGKYEQGTGSHTTEILDAVRFQ